ncbi:MAG: hypothetical protein Q4C45_09765 [Oscillospiraceae bacterium]|nr:hypothetical protein [Oscillospiraceae bacterium]
MYYTLFDFLQNRIAPVIRLLTRRMDFQRIRINFASLLFMFRALSASFIFVFDGCLLMRDAVLLRAHQQHRQRHDHRAARQADDAAGPVFQAVLILGAATLPEQRL